MGVKKTKKSKKGLITFIVIIILAALIGSGVFFLRKKNTEPKTEQSAEYTVREETFENVIEITGNVSAAASQDLKAAGSGSVTAVYVKEGDFVKKGQVILAMDATEQEYALAKHDYDMDQKRINGSAKELELMEKQRSVLVQKLEDRKVTAYFDGIIAQLTAASGDYLDAKDTVGVLIDRSYMKASVEIVETDASKLKVNQNVNFSFPAYPNRIVEGYVVAYPSVGRVTSRGATVVDAEVRINNPPSQILPNYSFTGEIEVTSPVTVTIVERQAIAYNSGKPYAEIIQKDGSTKKVDIEITPYGSAYVSIVSGLSPGDVLKNQGSAASGRLRVTGSAPVPVDGGTAPSGAPSGAPGVSPASGTTTTTTTTTTGARGGMGGGSAGGMTPMIRP